MADGGAVGSERISFGVHAYQSTLEHAAPVGCRSGSGQEFPARENQRGFPKTEATSHVCCVLCSTVDCELRVRERYLTVCLFTLPPHAEL